ncbi:MAG: hypothetical protein IKV91_04595 [Bacteroidales bacterium]|nr:hypothetical protein [Bacteroidales bacterium]
MKRIAIIVIMLAATVAAYAQEAGLAGMKAENVSYTKNGDYMAVTIDMLTSDIDLKHDRALVITPYVTNADSTVTLKSVGLYSYTRWHYYKRNGETMITGSDETSFMKKETPEVVSYEAVFPYHPWMDGSKLHVKVSEYGCCSKIIKEDSAYLAGYEGPYYPEFLYISPKAEIEKTRFLSGTAYIGFPVNETVIYPNFQNNVAELGKIRSTIDSVRNDSDVTIKSLAIKGFASPESPYDNNARLAAGRTEAVKQYVNDLYHFAPDFIQTSYEPEDWEGLRKMVMESNLPHKAEIIGLIDSDREPDNKEWKIKSVYKDDYRYMLDNFYPYLRHSDYFIEYVIRSYSDPKEIGVVIKTKPQNLSLEEFYAYAMTLEAGSPEFVEVFETAVRMYPTDEVANLNAANTAMSRGDMNNALRYLDKAGNSLEAEYARGVYEFLHENYNAAKEIFEKVLEAGVEQAREPIEKINKYNKL